VSAAPLRSAPSQRPFAAPRFASGQLKRTTSAKQHFYSGSRNKGKEEREDDDDDDDEEEEEEAEDEDEDEELEEERAERRKKRLRKMKQDEAQGRKRKKMRGFRPRKRHYAVGDNADMLIRCGRRFHCTLIDQS